MAFTKVTKALSVLVEETSLLVVDKLVAFLDTKIEMDDDMKQMFEDFKTQLKEQLKEEAKAAAKGGKKKIAVDENGEKKKRAPSAYNLFIKEKMAAIKQKNPEMASKDVMKEAIAMWKAQKGTSSSEESGDEKPVEEAPKEEAPKEEPKPKAKKAAAKKQ